ncbi:MAG TPA: carboxypeptidase-like regulatory domain-containing protein [Terriglobales bacterium]
MFPTDCRFEAKVQGVVTDEGGYPLPRSTVTLTDAAGKVLGTANIKKDGRYEIVLEQPCAGCSLKADRTGFVAQSHSGINYNGSNSLWFGFALKRVQ